eukprot:23571-Rhodomonas_salina.1
MVCYLPDSRCLMVWVLSAGPTGPFFFAVECSVLSASGRSRFQWHMLGAREEVSHAPGSGSTHSLEPSSSHNNNNNNNNNNNSNADADRLAHTATPASRSERRLQQPGGGGAAAHEGGAREAEKRAVTRALSGLSRLKQRPSGLAADAGREEMLEHLVGEGQKL